MKKPPPVNHKKRRNILLTLLGAVVLAMMLNFAHSGLGYSFDVLKSIMISYIVLATCFTLSLVWNTPSESSMSNPVDLSWTRSSKRQVIKKDRFVGLAFSGSSSQTKVPKNECCGITRMAGQYYCSCGRAVVSKI